MDKIKLNPPEHIHNIIKFLVRYKIILVIIAASIILSSLFITISSLANINPTKQQITQAEESVKLIKINKDSIKVVESLKENNISIESIFDPNRYDPFNN